MKGVSFFRELWRGLSASSRTFLWFLLGYAVVIAVLSGAGTDKFERLHLVIDTSNGILSLLLAVFLLAEQHRMQPNIRKYLVIGFGFAATTEILHALVGIEWSGSMAWIEAYSSALRPATWPPSAYVLPLALVWIFWLIRRNASLRPALFAAGMTLLAVGLYVLAWLLPKYVDTGLLGIQRPTQVPLLLLLVGVIAAYWRERHEQPLFEGVALMGVLLFLSDLFMLYSTSPHEKFTMMAHAGKLVAYALLHTLQMRVAADDSRARGTAEAALLQEKERLQAALDELKYQKFALDQHAIVSITDVQGNITYTNQRFCDISGYSREELMGRNHRMLNSGTHPKEFFADLYKTIASGRVWRGEVCNRAKGGHLYWVAATMVPFLDERGRPTQYISIRSDITELKRAEQSLIAARNEAERANRAKSEFLSSMSHELRTPMNAILGFSQLLKREDLNAANKECVNEIYVAGRHLLELINEVLDLAKVESGRFSLSLEPGDVSAIAQECLTMIGTLAAKRGIRVDCGNMAGAVARVDRVRLKQALLNLLSNAIKYNRAGGSVALTVENGNAGRLRIRVTDSGPGIAAERLKELFQPFNRLGAESSGIEGTGIGLTITRRIVEKMGGTVDVESEVGVGSSFWIELPREAAAEATSDARQQVGAGDPPQRSDGEARHTVLYIEDNPANLKLVAQILGRHKHIHVLTAHTPELGIELAKTRQPDLILLDINMPGMDGYQVLEVFKADASLKAVPVVAITANAMPRDIERGRAAGFEDYLTKPLDVARFDEVIGRLL